MSLEFMTSKFPIAKKEHRCDVCGIKIEVGEKYNRVSMKYDGDFYDDCRCTDCVRCIEYYCDKTNDGEYFNDVVEDFFADEFCYDCIHGYKDENSLDDCEENIWHCPIIQKALKEREAVCSKNH